jgi:hypothetical protein
MAEWVSPPLKIMTRIPLILSLLALLPASAIAQNTWFVPDDFSTIQAGIDGSTNGDTVIVRDGTYFENINFNGKAITLSSERGPVHTIIDANQIGSVVTFNSGESQNSTLEGFSIRNGVGSIGTTVFGTPVLAGGGLFIDGSSPSIRDCFIYNNVLSSSGSGGGVWCFEASPQLDKCWIYGNSAEGGGGMFVHGTNCAPVLNECLLVGNSGTSGGGCLLSWASPSAVFNHCTFSLNSASNGGAINVNLSSMELNNCILWENQGQWGPEIYVYNGQSVTVTYSNIKGGFIGTGNIDLDPQFVDPVNNFDLQSSSPCIDAGDPASAPDPDGTRTDMGAFYFDQSGGAPTLSVSNLVAGQQVLVEVNNATPSNFSHFAWSVQGGGPTPTPWGDAMVTQPYNLTLLPTDVNGYASYTANIPTSAAGVTVWCHGTDVGTQSMLNALMLVIQ